MSSIVQHVRMIHVDCDGSYRRCLACLGLFQKVWVPVEKFERRGYRGLPTSEELVAYSLRVKELEKKEKK